MVSIREVVNAAISASKSHNSNIFQELRFGDYVQDVGFGTKRRHVFVYGSVAADREDRSFVGEAAEHERGDASSVWAFPSLTVSDYYLKLLVIWVPTLILRL